jgi:protein-S-isoprenylcysteine O-methyltransferase Ste14
MITLPSLQNILLSLTILLSTYLTDLVLTPPNPNPTSPETKDTVRPVTGPVFLLFRGGIVVIIGIYHSFLAQTYPWTPSRICPRPENLNPRLFTWNLHTVICLGLIIVAANVRLLAFKQLGPNFTFRLAPPKKLVTTGMYAYVQHPSYTMNVIVVAANAFLFERIDGVVACWLSEGTVESGWWRVAAGFCVLAAVLLMSARVRDEEAMLRGKFGREWEGWHRRTKRFIPFVF